MSWRGFLSGSLLLIALQASLSSDEATGRVGRMFSGIGDLARRLIDPSVAAIPDLSSGGGPSPAAGGGKANGKTQDQGDDQGQVGPDWAPWNWNLPPGML